MPCTGRRPARTVVEALMPSRPDEVSEVIAGSSRTAAPHGPGPPGGGPGRRAGRPERRPLSGRSAPEHLRISSGHWLGWSGDREAAVAVDWSTEWFTSIVWIISVTLASA